MSEIRTQFTEVPGALFWTCFGSCNLGLTDVFQLRAVTAGTDGGESSVADGYFRILCGVVPEQRFAARA